MSPNSAVGVRTAVDSYPLVSVIIPTYNRAGVICRTIDNVLAQTYQNTEIIIVDDGSTDDTLERLKKYGERIRLIRQANAGPSAARNRGIEAAEGEFVALQDSDDLWTPTKLERQVTLLQKAGKNVVCCLCNAQLKYADRKETTAFDLAWLFPPFEEGIWTNVAEVFSTRFIFFCQTAMIRREVFQRVRGFDEMLKYHEDYDLPLRLAMEGPWTFIRDPLTIWNQGSNESWSAKALAEEILMRECEIKMRKNILSMIEGRADCERLRKYLRRELGRNYRELWISKLHESSFPGRRFLSTVLARLNRYTWGVYRRTRWYPMFEGTPIAS